MEDFTTHKGHLFLKADDSLQAWEKINEYLALNEKDVFKRGGVIYSSELISHNNIIRIKNGHIPETFEFGKTLGYSKAKWSALVNNYVDRNYIDLLRSEISQRRGKNAKNYNYSFHFSNNQGNGKDCLISLVFHKRVKSDIPILFFNLRTSEVTKRLLWDFLLVQRIGEHIYGDQPFEIECFFPSMYITAESFCLYHLHKDLPKLLKDSYKDNPYQQKIIKQYRYLSESPLETIKYKVHHRVAEMLQIKNNKQENPKKSLMTKDLIL